MFVSLETKIKHKILDEFNADLYRNFNMTLSDADDLYVGDLVIFIKL